jgi:hypothetical protein
VPNEYGPTAEYRACGKFQGHSVLAATGAYRTMHQQKADAEII